MTHTVFSAFQPHTFSASLPTPFICERYSSDKLVPDDAIEAKTIPSVAKLISSILLAHFTFRSSSARQAPLVSFLSARKISVSPRSFSSLAHTAAETAHTCCTLTICTKSLHACSKIMDDTDATPGRRRTLLQASILVEVRGQEESQSAAVFFLSGIHGTAACGCSPVRV